jgi:hypothetical protein
MSGKGYVSLAMVPVYFVLSPSSTLRAQSSITVDVPITALIAKTSQACRYSFAWRYDQASAKNPVSDTVFVRVYKDSSFKDSTATPAAFEVRINTVSAKEIKSGRSLDTVFPGPFALAERIISVWPYNSVTPICAVPTPGASAAVGLPDSTHTDFIASGEVSNALRTGSENHSATGSLGIHHVSYSEPGKPVSLYFPFLFRTGIIDVPVNVEELWTTISVASTIDTLTGSPGQNFSQAVLTPLGAAHGLGSSVQLEYSPLHEYGELHQQFGLHFRFAGARSLWAPDTGSTKKAAGPEMTTVLLGFDARLKWIAINRRRDVNGNNFQFALDLGYVQRVIAGDAIDSTATFINRALGQPRNRFTGYATGIYLSLRQVTAYADFLCLSCRFWKIGGREGTKIQSLEGLQPIIGFRYEAPFFSLR